MRMPFLWGSVMGASLVLGVALPRPLEGQTEEYENLQALPPDISRDELGDTMLGFLGALGLPRRAGQGCLHCHEGSLDVPRREWDYASDAKRTKRTARQMIRMVQAINQEFLAGLEHRNAPDLAIGCATCHRGRVDPRPLASVLAEAERQGGLDSLVVTYRALFERYYGADAYDFRVGVLAGLARARAEEGRYAEALRLSALNEEAHAGDPQARRVTLGLEIQRALDEDGPEAALRRFERLRASEPAEVLTESILDAVGWRTFRLDREEDALPLFRANRAAFPDSYFTFESLVEARRGAGEITREEIIRQYEAYLQENPGHEMAQQNLTNHRRRGG